jgi:8-oxo-dGTP pyrophosphatase MutT (NUDIX family)
LTTNDPKDQITPFYKMLADLKQVYGSIFISRSNKVLLVRGRKSDKWSFPKGHPIEGETPFQCAKRETMEEVGLELPLFFEKLIPLRTGSYYIVRSREVTCTTQDPKEVEEIGWFSSRQIRANSMNVNVDVNAFLREYKDILCPPAPPIQSSNALLNRNASPAAAPAPTAEMV